MAPVFFNIGAIFIGAFAPGVSDVLKTYVFVLNFSKNSVKKLLSRLILFQLRYPTAN